jgi:hypothetical protein
VRQHAVERQVGRQPQHPDTRGENGDAAVGQDARLGQPVAQAVAGAAAGGAPGPVVGHGEHALPFHAHERPGRRMVDEERQP